MIEPTDLRCDLCRDETELAALEQRMVRWRAPGAEGPYGRVLACRDAWACYARRVLWQGRDWPLATIPEPSRP